MQAAAATFQPPRRPADAAASRCRRPHPTLIVSSLIASSQGFTPGASPRRPADHPRLADPEKHRGRGRGRLRSPPRECMASEENDSRGPPFRPSCRAQRSPNRHRQRWRSEREQHKQGGHDNQRANRELHAITFENARATCDHDSTQSRPNGTCGEFRKAVNAHNPGQHRIGELFDHIGIRSMLLIAPVNPSTSITGAMQGLQDFPDMARKNSAIHQTRG